MEEPVSCVSPLLGTVSGIPTRSPTDYQGNHGIDRRRYFFEKHILTGRERNPRANIPVPSDKRNTRYIQAGGASPRVKFPES